MNAARNESVPPGSSPSDFNSADTESHELTSIAVIGAVKRPAVFETTRRSVPLGELIEQAGGLTAKSLGTVCIMDRGRTRVLVNLDRSAAQQIEHGQVVFVTSRGGSQAQPVMTSRQPVPDKLILLSGLSRSPLLFNIGNQSRTLGDLIVSLGQSPEMLDREEITPAHPEGGAMDLGSVLVSSTVVHFKSEAVNPAGIQQAVQNGFRFEQPINLDAPVADPINRSAPVDSIPPSTPQAVRKPENERRSAPPATSPVPPVAFNDTRANDGSAIEAVGSSVIFDEPLPFPPRFDTKQESILDATDQGSDGRVPLFLPRAWQHSDDSRRDVDIDEPTRKIDRTSAERTRSPKQIVTASAVIQRQPPREVHLAPKNRSSNFGIDEFEEMSSSLDTAAAGPPTWMILLIVVGVAAASVTVSRFMPRPVDFVIDSVEASASVAVEPPAEQSFVPEEDQRFLQRLIVNNVSLIEEEPIPPTVERLHGASVGARRMVFHEAHEGGVAGPHFKVRAPGHTRDLELRLRLLLRVENSSPQKAELVHAPTIPKSNAPKASPLERALRSVERGAV